MEFKLPDRMRLAVVLRGSLTFLNREWVSLFVSSSIGISMAALFRLLFSDRHFAQFSKPRYAVIESAFDGKDAYWPLMIGVVLMLAFAITPMAAKLAFRGVRSWWAGVTSGLRLLPF